MKLTTNLLIHEQIITRILAYQYQQHVMALKLVAQNSFFIYAVHETRTDVSLTILARRLSSNKGGTIYDNRWQWKVHV